LKIFCTLFPHSAFRSGVYLSTLLLAPVTLLIDHGAAKAVLTYTIFESGGHVVMQASGSLVLPKSFGYTNCSSYAGGGWEPLKGLLCTGPYKYADSPQSVYKIVGPTTFPGVQAYSASDAHSGYSTTLFVSNFFGLSAGPYVGGEIRSESVYFNKTLAGDFSISTSGLFGTWTLQPANSGDPYTAYDTINMVIGGPPAPLGPPPPVPGPLPVLGVCAAFRWSRRLRQRIASPSPTAPQA